MKNPYDEGWFSKIEGKTELDNPYHRNQYAYEMWLEGFLDKEEIERLNYVRSIESTKK